MTIGTRSVLFGAHQFLIHPWFVAWAWWQLYGFPWDVRLWFAFFLHDLGYVSLPNMDGPEGERHPEWAARTMGRMFGQEWHDLCLYHSRFYAKRNGQHFSRLCVADKLAIALTPWWFYLPLVHLTGEVVEYRRLAVERATSRSLRIAGAKGSRIWYRELQAYMRQWVEEHKEGQLDTWTPDMKNRTAKTASGVWQ